MQLEIRPETLAELKRVCVRALPAKRFGVLAGRADSLAEEVHPMERNLRDHSELVDRVFRSYGSFYQRKDRGFCFDPAELETVERDLNRRGRRIVAVFHSHRCKRAKPSQVDLDLHLSPNVYSVLVSVRNPNAPEVRVFTIREGSATATPLLVPGSRERRSA